MAPEALERILDAVGKKFVPADLNRAALMDDLEHAAREFRLGQHYRKAPAEKQEKLKRMARYAQMLINALRDDDVARIALEALPDNVRRAMLASNFDLTDFFAALVEAPEGKTLEPDERKLSQRLVAALSTLVEAPTQHMRGRDKLTALKRSMGVGDASAFRWLVGVTFPEIYERHFKRMAGVSRNAAAKVRGPYVRFVKAALSELGISKSGKPYKPETIAAALHGEKQGPRELKNTI